MTVWVPPLFDKQFELLRLCREQNGLRKYIMASGSRWSGKTVACLNAVVDHAWNTKNAAISVLCTSISAGADSGVWSLLTEVIIPQWISGDFGLDWAEKGTPRQHHVTKKFYCLIKNKHGGTSRIQLDSLKKEIEVEQDFKNRYLTMIYWSEVTNFHDPKTYHTLIQALRGLGVPQDQFVFLGDCNPADDGEDHFVYKEWYVFRLTDPAKLSDNERPRQRYLRLMEFFPDDNPFLTEEFKLQKKAEFSADPDLFARYWLGQWKKSSTDALFVGQFRRSIHVIASEGESSDPQICVPEEDCQELDLGWDIGQSNHAVVFAEKIYVQIGQQSRAAFKFFDEVVIISGIVSIAELTDMVLEKMSRWEDFLGHEVKWKHWSDRSSLDQRLVTSKRFPVEEVLDASAGEILLSGVDNTPGSLAPSVRLWRNMLHQNRLLFSDQCQKLVEMNTSLKSRDRIPDTVRDSVHKHPFDAARYIIMGELWDELVNSIITKSRVSSRRRVRYPSMVHVPL